MIGAYVGLMFIMYLDWCLLRNTHTRTRTHEGDKLAEARAGSQTSLALYGSRNGPNLDKDSSEIAVCPVREAPACACASIFPRQRRRCHSNPPGDGGESLQAAVFKRGGGAARQKGGA